MNSGYWIFFELFLCLIEIIMFRFFMIGFGRIKQSSMIQEVVVTGVATTCIYLKGWLQLPLVVSLLMVIIILSIYAACICEMKYYQYLVFAGSFVLLIFILDFGVTVLMQLILPINVLDTFMESKSSRFICAIFSKLFLLVIVMLLLKKDKEKGEALSTTSMLLLLSAVVISYICLYSLIQFENISNFTMSEQENFYVCLLSLGIFLIDSLIYIVIRQLNHRINKEKKMQMVQYQNELLEKMVLENKEVEKEWRRNRHDFNNHLSCVDMLLQMENIPKARAYIQNLTQNYLGNTTKIRVGNKIAEAVINQKYVLANKKQIVMTVEGSIEEEIPIEQMDLCALLSNSLDNAIEAAEKVKEVDKRYIHLKVRSNDNNLVIEVCNGVKEDITSKQKKLETSKKDEKHHGIGMTSMQMTLEKYRGYMNWKCKDRCFSLVMLLPIING